MTTNENICGVLGDGAVDREDEIMRNSMVYWLTFICQKLSPFMGEAAIIMGNVAFSPAELLFISYKFVKGFLAITFLLLVISS